MLKRLSSRIVVLLSIVLLGMVSVLPGGVVHADGYGYYRGTYCNPGGNDPCMTVYLDPSHNSVTLTWSSNRHNKYQIRSDPPLDRHGNPQLEFGGDVNT